jgi:hypothetical protein
MPEQETGSSPAEEGIGKLINLTHTQTRKLFPGQRQIRDRAQKLGIPDIDGMFKHLVQRLKAAKKAR